MHYLYFYSVSFIQALLKLVQAPFVAMEQLFLTEPRTIVLPERPLLAPEAVKDFLKDTAPAFIHFLELKGVGDSTIINIYYYFGGAEELLKRIDNEAALLTAVKNLETYRARQRNCLKYAHAYHQQVENIQVLTEVNWKVLARNRLRALGYPLGLTDAVADKQVC